MMPVPVWQGRTTPLQMGLKTCAVEDWVNGPDIFGDSDRIQTQLALKKTLLDSNLSEVFAALPDSFDACAELSGLIGAACDVSIGLDEHPLLAAGRYVADDLLLLSNEDGHSDWVLKAALLAFPSHWALVDKIGKPMHAIHAPVPAYADRLETPVNRFFNAMQPEVVSYRLNWTLQVGDALFTPHPSEDEISAPRNIPTDLFVRSERQTFRKLPTASQTDGSWIVFGIATHIAPLGLWQDQPEALKDLQQAVQALSPDMKAYRGVVRYEDAFNKWVDSITG